MAKRYEDSDLAFEERGVVGVGHLRRSLASHQYKSNSDACVGLALAGDLPTLVV